MDIREFFFWVASITLILIGLAVIGFMALLFYLKRLADRTAERLIMRLDEMSESVSSAGRAWRSLTLTRFIIKTLRMIF